MNTKEKLTQLYSYNKKTKKRIESIKEYIKEDPDWIKDSIDWLKELEIAIILRIRINFEISEIENGF